MAVHCDGLVTGLDEVDEVVGECVVPEVVVEVHEMLEFAGSHRLVAGDGSRIGRFDSCLGSRMAVHHCYLAGSSAEATVAIVDSLLEVHSSAAVADIPREVADVLAVVVGVLAAVADILALAAGILAVVDVADSPVLVVALADNCLDEAVDVPALADSRLEGFGDSSLVVAVVAAAFVAVYTGHTSPGRPERRP